MASRPLESLEIAINGLPVGRLDRERSGALSLTYAEGWLDAPGALPISLSLPLGSLPLTGARVESWFDNLLPDSDDVRARMQRKLGASSRRPFDLLAVAGRDCVGAVQLLPEATLEDVRRVESLPLSETEIAARLRDQRNRPLGMGGKDEEFRISLAGAQEKTAYLWHEGRWHLPLGPTPTTHVFKLPIGPTASGIDLSDSVENEWLCLRIARAFGLPVAEAEIRTFEDVRVLVTKRFDRAWHDDGSWIVRQPQEDACQALGVSREHKYESDGGPGVREVMDLWMQSVESRTDRENLFRAFVLNWLLAAPDGHAKNFSLFLLPEGRCRATPLYDVLSAHPMMSRGELHPSEVRMAMAVDGKNRHYRWNEIQARHWETTARRARFSVEEAREITEELLARTPDVVEEVREALPSGFPEPLAEAVLNGLSETAGRGRTRSSRIR